MNTIGKNEDNLPAYESHVSRILRQIHDLSLGQLVTIHWYDAVRVRGDPEITPRVWEASKETDGRYAGCFRDPGSKTVCIVVQGERTRGQPDYYDAIPVGCIDFIEEGPRVQRRLMKSLRLARPPMLTRTIVERLVIVRDK